MHPPVAQAPATQLLSTHTFEHAPSPLLRQCNVHEGVTRDLSVVGVGTKNNILFLFLFFPKICPFKVHWPGLQKLQVSSNLELSPNLMWMDMLEMFVFIFQQCLYAKALNMHMCSCPSVLTALPQESKVPQPCVVHFFPCPFDGVMQLSLSMGDTIAVSKCHCCLHCGHLCFK